MGIIQVLQYDLHARDDILEKFHNGVQVEDNKEYTMKMRPSSTKNAQTMTEVCIVSNSPCSLSSHKYVEASFGEFEQHTWGIHSKLLTKMGFYEKGILINL